jgi:hypothetical protein
MRRRPRQHRSLDVASHALEVTDALAMIDADVSNEIARCTAHARGTQ